MQIRAPEMTAARAIIVTGKVFLESEFLVFDNQNAVDIASGIPEIVIHHLSKRVKIDSHIVEMRGVPAIPHLFGNTVRIWGIFGLLLYLLAGKKVQQETYSQ
jgi:hypothetical protein